MAGGGHSGGGALSFYRLDPATRKLENVTGGVAGAWQPGGPSAHGFCLYNSAGQRQVLRLRRRPVRHVKQFELTDDGTARWRPNGGPPVRGRAPPALGQARPTPSRPASPTRTGGASSWPSRTGTSGATAPSPPTPAAPADRVLVDKEPSEGGHFTARGRGPGPRHRAGWRQLSHRLLPGRLTPSPSTAASAPYDFVRKVKVVGSATADGCERTDGIDAVAANLGPAFPQGLFVCQDNNNAAPAPGNMNFKFVPPGADGRHSAARAAGSSPASAASPSLSPSPSRRRSRSPEPQPQPRPQPPRRRLPPRHRATGCSARPARSTPSATPAPMASQPAVLRRPGRRPRAHARRARATGWSTTGARSPPTATPPPRQRRRRRAWPPARR